MPLSEANGINNDRLVLAHFEQQLMELLERYKRAQKEIIHLKKENETLKVLLQGSKSQLSTATKDSALVLPQALIKKINQAIQEIDACLAYFQQV